eukprot:10139597-Karenia_brevis.AAC.1
MPTLQWARIAFEQGSFDWLRQIATKSGDVSLVPMLNGPGGYMVADDLASYDFDVACPKVEELTHHSISNLDEYLAMFKDVAHDERDY